MIVLLLAWLLNSLHYVAPYRYLPESALANSYGTNNGPQKCFANLNDIPFHVLVVYSNLYCSGTLVRSKIVMTVASCLIPYRYRKPVVKLGVDSITGQGQIIPVMEIKIHEYYKYMAQIDNDIALLMLKVSIRYCQKQCKQKRLEAPMRDLPRTLSRFNPPLNMVDVVFSPVVKKAVLVEPETVLRNGVVIEVSGWGNNNLPQTYVNQLLWTEMVVIEKKECAKYYKHLLTPSNFCAKYPPERRLSDNGGPAVYDRELVVGILSYGGTSVDEPHIAIFSNVSYFSRWITLNTKRFLEKYCVQKDTDSAEYYILSDENSS